MSRCCVKLFVCTFKANPHAPAAGPHRGITHSDHSAKIPYSDQSFFEWDPATMLAMRKKNGDKDMGIEEKTTTQRCNYDQLMMKDSLFTLVKFNTTGKRD